MSHKTLENVTLRRLSICPCGHSVLNDQIKLGARFRVDLASVRKGFVYTCGECLLTQPDVTVVLASQSSRSGLAFLPLALFQGAELLTMWPRGISGGETVTHNPVLDADWDDVRLCELLLLDMVGRTTPEEECAIDFRLNEFLQIHAHGCGNMEGAD